MNTYNTLSAAESILRETFHKSCGAMKTIYALGLKHKMYHKWYDLEDEYFRALMVIHKEIDKLYD